MLDSGFNVSGYVQNYTVKLKNKPYIEIPNELNCTNYKVMNPDVRVISQL